MKKAFAMTFALLVLAGISACGQKGPLVLPPPEPAQQEEPAESE